jgi:hypothetical protein
VSVAIEVMIVRLRSVACQTPDQPGRPDELQSMRYIVVGSQRKHGGQAPGAPHVQRRRHQQLAAWPAVAASPSSCADPEPPLLSAPTVPRTQCCHAAVEHNLSLQHVHQELRSSLCRRYLRRLVGRVCAEQGLAPLQAPLHLIRLRCLHCRGRWPVPAQACEQD